MTDRELLENAAKAAGMNTRYYHFEFTGEWGMIDDDPDGILWNPLVDDAHALRLAVKIGLRDYFGVEIQKTCVQATCFEPWEHCQYEEHNNDPYAATRRAVVRAAAEIGRAME